MTELRRRARALAAYLAEHLPQDHATERANNVAAALVDGIEDDEEVIRDALEDHWSLPVQLPEPVIIEAVAIWRGN